MTTYAAYSLDQDERIASSSGGIFSLLAKEILADDGVVYGVALMGDCQSAEFIRVVDEKELVRLRGSKYFQAQVGNSYRQVKIDLEEGRVVLFSGTPCQINGLICYLSEGGDFENTRSHYKNLCCVDVVCHGVPSPELWRNYVDYVESVNHAKLVDVNFRCKDKGWVDFGVKEISETHRAMFISKNTDPFMQMFLRDYCLRPSCYKCVVKENKLSDLTLADFWGIEKVAPEMTDGNGTSMVIIRSDKGRELFFRIKEHLNQREVPYEAGVKYNPAEWKSAERPYQRDTFFVDMQNMTFEELKTKYAPPISDSLKRRVKMIVKQIMAKTGKRGGY